MWIPVLQEVDVHRESGGSAIAVDEWMDADDVLVELSGDKNGMGSCACQLVLLPQAIHEVSDFVRGRGYMLGTDDSYGHIAEAACICIVYTGEDDSVQLEHNVVGQWSGVGYEIVDNLQGCGEVNGFEVILERFACHGDSVRDDKLCLTEGEGVALDGVRLIDSFDFAGFEDGMELLQLLLR